MYRILLIAVITVAVSAWCFLSGHYVVALASLLGGVVLSREVRPSARPIKRNFPFLFQLHELIDNRSAAVPYSSDVKRYITGASKGMTEASFGVKDVLVDNFIAHTAFPTVVRTIDGTLIGTARQRPYESKVINISGMGFGPLSANAVSALCVAANHFGCFINTGEDGYSPFHDAAQNVVMQLGPGYSGVQNNIGGLDRERFKQKANRHNVSMIEIKLSQGAKPGTGCTLPASKVTELVAKSQRVEVGRPIVPCSFHTEFSNWTEMLFFVDELRELSGGRPVGVKLCIGREDEVDEFVREMQRQSIVPDFITVDGAEGGSGGSTYDFLKCVGMPLLDAVEYIHLKLQEAKLRERVALLASGKISTPYDVFRAISAGADVCNLGRSVLISLGCEQAMKCHTGKCPTGIASHNFYLRSGLTVDAGSERVYKYMTSLEDGVRLLMGASGCKNISDMQKGASIYRRDKECNATRQIKYDNLLCQIGHDRIV